MKDRWILIAFLTQWLCVVNAVSAQSQRLPAGLDGLLTNPALNTAAANPRDTFLSGDVESAIRLADEEATRARNQTDDNLLMDALYWRGVASAAKRLDADADNAWREAVEAAKRTHSSSSQIRLFGVRSLLALASVERRSEHRRLWLEALTAVTNDVMAVTNAITLTVLGVVEAHEARAFSPARDAFRRAARLLERTESAAAQQAVIQYDLALTESRLGPAQRSQIIQGLHLKPR